MTNDELQYILSWIKLDQLCSSDQGDSDEAESIRDNMDMYWLYMTPEQQSQTKTIITTIATHYCTELTETPVAHYKPNDVIATEDGNYTVISWDEYEKHHPGSISANSSRQHEFVPVKNEQGQMFGVEKVDIIGIYKKA